MTNTAKLGMEFPCTCALHCTYQCFICHATKTLVWMYNFSLILKKESESIFDFLFHVWNRKKIVSLITHQTAWFFLSRFQVAWLPSISSCLTTMFQLRYFDFLTLYFSLNFTMVLVWIKTNKKTSSFMMKSFGNP